MTASPQSTTLSVTGMTCAQCEVAIERALKGIPGVTSVRARAHGGTVRVSHDAPLDLDAIGTALAAEGYRLEGQASEDGARAGRNTPRDYAEIAALVLIFIGGLFALHATGVLTSGYGLSDTMSLGLVFAIGLVASVSSCIAVTGGLLVAVAAKYNEASGAQPGMQRLRPLLWFNAGRILSYTLLGGAVGALGSVLTLSAQANGILTLVASAIMIVLGLNMLRLVPAALIPTMPKRLAHAVHDLSTREVKGGAFLLGAATFFLPCGFTQALQLYVLAKGSFTAGALTMLVFALGTLPALLSLSAVSSFARGAFQNHFLKAAGVAVVIMGLLNIQYGLVLSDSASIKPPTVKQADAADTATAKMENGRQVAVMRVIDFGYEPSHIIVRENILVEWRIDASEAAGCGRILIAPKLGIRRILSDKSTTTIQFTPRQTGDFAFNCGMGMMTPGARITVVPNA